MPSQKASKDYTDQYDVIAKVSWKTRNHLRVFHDQIYPKRNPRKSNYSFKLIISNTAPET